MKQKKFSSLFLICITAVLLSCICLAPCQKASAAACKTSSIDFSDSELVSLASRKSSVVEISYSSDVKYKNGDGALKFEVLTSSKNAETKRFSFAENNIITNWNQVSYITFTIYNSVAGTDVLNVVFSKSADTIDNGYYRSTILLDWTGWKNISISTDDFRASKGITSWEEINSVYFNMAGWSGQSTQGTCFYIASVKAGYNYGLIAPESLPESLAVYADKTNAMYLNTEIELPNSPVYQNDILYLPINMFNDILNISCYENTLNYNNITAMFTDMSNTVDVGAYKYTLCAPAFTENKALYVPLRDICRIFDLDYIEDGRFAAIGSENDISFVNVHNDNGVNILTEEITDVICASENTGTAYADCESIINKWILEIAGSEEINSTDDSSVKRRIRNINSYAEDSWSKLIKENAGSQLFTDITATTTAAMTSTSEHIYNMALAYATYGGENYKNEELLSDILYALDWFYEYRYGEDEAQNNENAWRDRTLYNWWDWRIGTPQNLIPTLMIVRSEISSEDMAKYLDCFNTIVPLPTSTGSNYINISRLIIGASALLGDTEKIEEISQLVLTTFDYVDNGRNPESKLDSIRAQYTPNRGQGFYKDGSYVYHTLHAMNGSYGLSHLNMASDIVALLANTSFELPKYCADNIADWIIDSFDTLMYKNSFPRMVVGRNENPSGLTQSRTIVKAAVRCFDLFSENDKELVGSVIKEYSSYNTDNFVYNVDICHIPDIRNILASDKYNSYNYENSTVFANMDKAMHKRSDWAVGISMSSSRIFNYESINGANKDGWYLGDGRYEILIGSEGASSAESYWQYINPYRMPGTTVDTQLRQEVSIAQGNEYLSSKDFVGGAVMNGKYLTAAMHLESYHNASEQGEENGSYGSSAPAHTCDLTAKKSYFAFDNEIYCLGAEINASNNNNAEVLTVIDNRILSDKLISQNGDITLTSDDVNYNNITWLNADNKISYYFPTSDKSQLYLRSVTNTNTYFEAVLNHGVNPFSASYAYAILPGMTADETIEYVKNPAVEILTNTGDVQAVKNTELGITSIVFWNEGSYGGITVDSPMIVILKEGKNQLEISVSDPTQKLKDAKISFNKPLALIKSDKSISQDTIGTESVLNIDFTDSLGKSFNATLRHTLPVGLKIDLYNKDGEALNPYNAHKCEEITASVSAANLSDDSEDVMLALAMYSSDGTLQNVKLQKFAPLSGEKFQMDSVSFVPDSETVLIKGFVWNQTTLMPFDIINIK